MLGERISDLQIIFKIKRIFIIRMMFIFVLLIIQFNFVSEVFALGHCGSAPSTGVCAPAPEPAPPPPPKPMPDGGKPVPSTPPPPEQTPVPGPGTTPAPVTEPTPAPVTEPTPAPVTEPTPAPVAGPAPLPDNLPPNISSDEEFGRNLGYPAGGTTCANISNPINSATGNKVETAIDYQGSGSSSLKFVRYYNSTSTVKVNMGFNWRHNYDRAIVLDNAVSPKTATVKSADGSEVIFFELASGWTARPGVEAKLSDTETEWTYIDKNDNVELYSKVSGSTISSISKTTNRAGRSQSFSYLAGMLDKVTDDFSHSLSFSYDTQGRLKTITDPALEVIQFNYVNDNIDTVIYQDLKKIQYLYDQAGLPHHLTGIIDQNNNRSATWSYYADGKGKSSSHGDGLAENVAISNNADGSSVYTSGLGQKNTYNHVDSNGVHKVATITGAKCLDCGAYGQSTTYDVNGYKDLVKDYNGNVTDYDYNGRGLVVQLIEAKGTTEQRITKTTWDNILHIPTCRITPRNSIALTYNAAGQLLIRSIYDTTDTSLFDSAATKTCDAIAGRTDLSTLNKRITTYSYYPNGLLKKVDGPRTDTQDVTNYLYDTTGNLTSITNALGHTIIFKNYDAHGHPQMVVDANGLITTISYDLLGRKDIVTIGSEITDYDYYPNGTLDKVTLADGSFLDYRYDAAKRLTAVYDHLGNYIFYGLNDLGSRTKIEVNDSTGALKRTQTAQYDLENHLKKSLGSVNQTTDYLEHDGNGNVKKVRDPGLNNTSHTYDALNRLKTTTDAKNGISEYHYDIQNNLISVTDPRANVTLYTYDGLGNRTQMTSPDTGITNYTSYDAVGNLLSKTDALDKTTTYQYDALNRLDLVTYQDGTSTDYVYDEGVNAKGRRSSITYDGGANSFADIITDSWTYDSYGRVLSKTQTNGAVVLSTSYTYDATTGQLSTQTTPGGHKLVYSYLNGQITSISVDSKMVMKNISYDPFGPPNNWTFGNNSIINRVYDKDGQLINYPEAGVTMINSYFPTGNLKNVKEVGSATNIFDGEYFYDELNRVISYTADGQTEAYDYDPNNNRFLQTINLLSYTSIFELSSNQIKTVPGPITKSYTFNLAGNTTSDGVHTYSYDDRGRLTSLDSKAVEYAINGLGHRIRKRGGFERDGDLDDDGVVDDKDRTIIEDAVAGNITAEEEHDRNIDMVVNQTDITRFDNMISSGKNKETYGFDERFVYNEQGQLEGEYDGAGNVVQEYIWFAGLPVALLRGSEVFYIDTDHLGTPISISDKTQEVVWEWDAEPYGRALPDVDFDGDRNLFVFNLRFPGQYYDHETGLHYNINRFYDPLTGRYLESDPVGLDGGLNTYGYALGNPVKYTDPDGLAPILRGKGTRAGKFDSCKINQEGCKYLQSAMRSVAAEINSRAEEMLVDVCDLYHKAYALPNLNNNCGGKTTWLSHREEMASTQRHLKNIIKVALRNNCSIPRTVERASIRRIPNKPRGLKF